jgi:hypothetical protein
MKDPEPNHGARSPWPCPEPRFNEQKLKFSVQEKSCLLDSTVSEDAGIEPRTVATCIDSHSLQPLG